MSTVRLPAGHFILACKVFAPELELAGIPPERVLYLDQGLHNFPDKLQEEIKSALATLEARDDVDTAILLYGYCGGGLKDISSDRLTLVIPLVHDCIPLLLGGDPAGSQNAEGQSYYLSAGWIDHGQTPLKEHLKNVDKFGEEDALWVGRKMLAGYSHIALITSELTEHPRYREHAVQCARLFDLELRELPGSFSWLRRLLAGKQSPGLMVLRPGEKITLSLFLDCQACVK